MADNITPFVAALLACVCEQLVADGRPACECCQVASQDLPPMTGCDCVCEGGQGRAWARFDGATWQQSDLAKCPVGPWEARFQVGVYRCVPQDGTCESSGVEAALVAADAASLTRAVMCCPALPSRWSLGDVEIVGPTGGCVGVAVTITIQLSTLIVP